MNPILHKILVHASVIIENALLSIVQFLLEEATETRSMHFCLYRETFARKLSRESTTSKYTLDYTLYIRTIHLANMKKHFYQDHFALKL